MAGRKIVEQATGQTGLSGTPGVGQPTLAGEAQGPAKVLDLHGGSALETGGRKPQTCRFKAARSAPPKRLGLGVHALGIQVVRQVVVAAGRVRMVFSQNLLADGQGPAVDWLGFHVLALGI